MQEQFDSFWGHIQELRQTLVRTFIIVCVGFVALLCFYQPILRVLTSIPGETGFAMHKMERVQIVNGSAAREFVMPEDSIWISGGEVNGHRQYHLAQREILVYDQIIRTPLLIMGPLEGLILVFKACFWLSIAITAPFWGWVWLQFILPGIHSQERLVLIPFLSGSILCVMGGCLLAYWMTLPLANEYLSLFNHSIGQNAWTINHYVNYVLFLCLGHAIAAEIAFLLLGLVHYRFLTPEWLISKRKYMIVGAFILGALLTPPDVLTQILMAVPLIGVYEVAILYAKWRKPKLLHLHVD